MSLVDNCFHMKQEIIIWFGLKYEDNWSFCVTCKYGGTLYVPASSVKKIICGMCHISVVCLI